MKKFLLHQTLVFITHGKTLKTHTITINLKYLHPHGMMNLNYKMDRILCQIFKIILNTFKKKHEEDIDEPSVQIYVDEIENRITINITNGHSLELLTPETIKLLGSTKNKINEDKNGENIPHLKITEVVLVHCNIVHNDYQQDSRVFILLFPINHSVVY